MSKASIAPATPAVPVDVPSKVAEPTQEPAPEVKDKEPVHGNDNNVQEDDEVDVIDYTKMPAALDAKFDQLDKEGGVRPTTIKPGTVWRKKFQKALLAQPSEKSLNKDGLRDEKNKAFDLLDALSKSG